MLRKWSGKFEGTGSFRDIAAMLPPIFEPSKKFSFACRAWWKTFPKSASWISIPFLHSHQDKVVPLSMRGSGWKKSEKEAGTQIRGPRSQIGCTKSRIDEHSPPFKGGVAAPSNHVPVP